MGFSINLNVGGAAIGQLVVGGAAAVGGFMLASSAVKNAYHDDMFGDPTKILEVEGGRVIYVNRELMGDKLTKYTLGAGGLSAAAGFVLAGSAIQAAAAGATKGVGHALKIGGGAALFALGVGAIAGALAVSGPYRGADHYPLR